MIIAEIGWNFLGNLNLAKKMIKSAHQNGCKYVKFQLWDPKNLKRGPWDKDGRREIYNKAYLSNENYFVLYKYSKLLNIDCFASVFSTYDYERLKEVSNKFIKMVKSNITLSNEEEADSSEIDIKKTEKSMIEIIPSKTSHGSTKSNSFSKPGYAKGRSTYRRK